MYEKSVNASRSWSRLDAKASSKPPSTSPLLANPAGEAWGNVSENRREGPGMERVYQDTLEPIL